VDRKQKSGPESPGGAPLDREREPAKPAAAIRFSRPDPHKKAARPMTPARG
jgi:hypothetical protein